MRSQLGIKATKNVTVNDVFDKINDDAMLLRTW